MKCKCGCEANDQVLTPEGPHYGKVVCQVCRKFLSWLPYPNRPVDPAKVPRLVSGDPLLSGELPKLKGRSPAQIAFGERCRSALIAKGRTCLDRYLYEAMLTITESTFWIANHEREPKQIRWPHEWS